jgi:formylglycine-generating enzyme required for sulfatase activity
MTFKILTKDDRVIHRSVVHSAMGTGAFINQKATAAAEQPKHNPTMVTSSEDIFQLEIQEDIIRAQREDASARGEPIPIIDTANLLGRTFINDPDLIGTQ